MHNGDFISMFSRFLTLLTPQSPAMSSNILELGSEEQLDAEAYFRLVSSGMKSILGDNAAGCDNDCISKTIDAIQACMQCTEREYLISKNEVIDDISTSTLKFLNLGYYLAKCYQNLKGMDNRLDNLLSCRDSYNTFLHLCSRLNLYHDADKELANSKAGGVSAEQKRTDKIDKFKRDRAAKARINELQRLLYITKKDGDVDHEDEMRELHLTQLQCYIRDSTDELDMLQQEMTMLRFHQSQQRNDGVEGSSSDGRMNNKPKGDGDGASKGMFLDNYGVNAGQSGPGISVTRTYKVGDQIMFSRDTVKAKVFGSHIAAPTMTLEEFGDQQKADALDRQQREQDGRADGTSAAMNARRMKQLEQDGDEDDADLADQAAMKDRAWDDWTDNNPRGWGNKAGKRF